MTNTRAIGAAQTVPRRGDVPANVEEHLRLADLAAGEGARLVVFPELSLTGYELDLAAELAFEEDDPRLDPLRQRAAELAATLVVGAPARLDGRLHVGAFVVAPTGSLDVYTKRRLGAFPASANPGGPVPPPEPSVFAPGDRDPLVLRAGCRAAVAVCADTGDPGHAAAAAERGADTYLASMFFTPPELEAERARLRGVATRHGMAVVLAGYGGPSGGLPSAGCSAVWSPTGELLAELGPAGAGAVVAVEQAAGWRAVARPLDG